MRTRGTDFKTFYRLLNFYPANTLRQECKKFLLQVAVATKFFKLVLNICGPSFWNTIHVTILAPNILGCFLDFCKFRTIMCLVTY